MQKFTVSNDKSIYEAWPDVVQTDSGKLICVFSECEHHCNRENARIMITESTDRGRTWSAKKPLTEKGVSDNYFNCARISKLLDGSLVIICDKLKGFDESSAKTYVWYGDKEGLNWSEPKIFDFNGIVPDKFLQLKNGRFIIANHTPSPETGKLEQHLWYSDDGVNWSDRITVASDARYNLCEISILECGNNTLVGFLRENSRIGCDVLKVVSYDNGETWSEIYTTPIACGHRPVAGFLKDGKVMITYRYIPGGAESRENFFAAIVSEDLLTATDRQQGYIRTFPIDYDRNHITDTGYSGWTQFDDGEIYVVNYIKDDCEKAYIRGYSFYPSDIALPE